MDEEKIITSPIKAIRAKCLDCMCNQVNEVKLCPSTNCPLYAFRFGKNPYSKKGQNMTDEQKKALTERLQKAREAKQNA